MEAKVPVLNATTEDTKILVNQGGYVRQIPVNEVVPKGVAVDDAAGSAPTAAEFKALLDSLRDAGIIETDEED